VPRGRLDVDPAALEAFCVRNRIRRLSLFGSVLKGTARPDSDVDLLVEFEPGATPSLLGMARMEEELSPLLGNRKIDLRTPLDLSRYFREVVVREAEVQYPARAAERHGEAERPGRLEARDAEANGEN
jgi:hypothetical protein